MAEEKIWTYKSLSNSHLNFLRIIAIVPLDSSLASRILNVYYYVVVFFYNTMFIYPSFKMYLDDGSLELGHVCEIIIVESICIRYLMFCKKRKEFAKLLAHCKELWDYVRPEETSSVKQFESKAYLVRTFMTYNAIFTAAVYVVTAVVVRLPPNEVNGTAQRILPIRFYVDVQDEPMYTLVAIFQSVVIFTIALVIAGIEVPGLYTIMMACGYLRCINNRLCTMTGYYEPRQQQPQHKHAVVTLNKRNRERDNYDIRPSQCGLSREDVVECAIFHQKILIFCQGIEHLTSGVYMTTVLCILYNLSLIAYKLLQSDSEMFNMLAVFCLHSISLFLCQWSPEHLINESRNISEAAYFATMEHPKFVKDTNRILSIMILRAQRPVQLTGAGYVRLSMQTFGSMISNAFSFFTVLRNFQ